MIGADPYEPFQSAEQLPPGKTFFIENPGSAFTNTFTGTVYGTSTNTLGPGFNVISSTYPVATNVAFLGLAVGLTNSSPTNGAGDVIYFLENGSFVGFEKNAYSPYTWYPTGPSCDPTNGPLVNPGQGFFYLNNQGVTFNWVQDFSTE